MKELIRVHDYTNKNYIDIFSHKNIIYISHWDESEFCETFEGELSNDDLIMLRDEIDNILYKQSQEENKNVIE